jgi:hypothetical protein
LVLDKPLGVNSSHAFQQELQQQQQEQQELQASITARRPDHRPSRRSSDSARSSQPRRQPPATASFPSTVGYAAEPQLQGTQVISAGEGGCICRGAGMQQRWLSAFQCPGPAQVAVLYAWQLATAFMEGPPHHPPTL